MSEPWYELAACSEPWFKQAAQAIIPYERNVQDTSQIFYPITETDDGRPVDAGSSRKYRRRQDRYRALARKACAECPVRMDCLFAALEHDQHGPHGLHGGLDERGQADLLDSPTAKIMQVHCSCGVKVFGTTNAPVLYCSEDCRIRDARKAKAAI